MMVSSWYLSKFNFKFGLNRKAVLFLNILLILLIRKSGFNMNRRIILTASFFGGMAVILGAFGAHGLKNLLTADALAIWTKGIEYQFYHTFALLFLATFARFRTKLVDFAFYCFTGGIIFFSGSLYLLATREIHHLNFVNFIGPVTPVGGLLLVAGWVLLFLAALKNR